MNISSQHSCATLDLTTPLSDQVCTQGSPRQRSGEHWGVWVWWDVYNVSVSLSLGDFLDRNEYLVFFHTCCLLMLWASFQGGKTSSLYGTSTSDGRHVTSTSNSTNQYREEISNADKYLMLNLYHHCDLDISTGGVCTHLRVTRKGSSRGMLLRILIFRSVGG